MTHLLWDPMVRKKWGDSFSVQCVYRHCYMRQRKDNKLVEFQIIENTCIAIWILLIGIHQITVQTHFQQSAWSPFYQFSQILKHFSPPWTKTGKVCWQLCLTEDVQLLSGIFLLTTHAYQLISSSRSIGTISPSYSPNHVNLQHNSP